MRPTSNEFHWVHQPLLQPMVTLKPLTWLGMPLQWRDMSLWAASRLRSADLWKPVMPDLAWLYGAYAMMGQMGAAAPVVHRSHIHQRRAPRKGAARSRRAGASAAAAAVAKRQQRRPSRSTGISSAPLLSSAPQHISFTAPNLHIHSAGSQPIRPASLKRARLRGLGVTIAPEKSVSQPIHAIGTKGDLQSFRPGTKNIRLSPTSVGKNVTKEVSSSNKGGPVHLRPRPMWTQSAAPEGSATARLVYEYGYPATQLLQSPRETAKSLEGSPAIHKYSRSTRTLARQKTNRVSEQPQWRKEIAEVPLRGGGSQIALTKTQRLEPKIEKFRQAGQSTPPFNNVSSSDNSSGNLQTSERPINEQGFVSTRAKVVPSRLRHLPSSFTPPWNHTRAPNIEGQPVFLRSPSLEAPTPNEGKASETKRVPLQKGLTDRRPAPPSISATQRSRGGKKQSGNISEEVSTSDFTKVPSRLVSKGVSVPTQPKWRQPSVSVNRKEKSVGFENQSSTQVQRFQAAEDIQISKAIKASVDSSEAPYKEDAQPRSSQKQYARVLEWQGASVWVTSKSEALERSATRITSLATPSASTSNLLVPTDKSKQTQELTVDNKRLKTSSDTKKSISTSTKNRTVGQVGSVQNQASPYAYKRRLLHAPKWRNTPVGIESSGAKTRIISPAVQSTLVQKKLVNTVLPEEKRQIEKENSHQESIRRAPSRNARERSRGTVPLPASKRPLNQALASKAQSSSPLLHVRAPQAPQWRAPIAVFATSKGQVSSDSPDDFKEKGTSSSVQGQPKITKVQTLNEGTTQERPPAIKKSLPQEPVGLAPKNQSRRRIYTQPVWRSRGLTRQIEPSSLSSPYVYSPKNDRQSFTPTIASGAVPPILAKQSKAEDSSSVAPTIKQEGSRLLATKGKIYPSGSGQITDGKLQKRKSTLPSKAKVVSTKSRLISTATKIFVPPRPQWSRPHIARPAQINEAKTEYLGPEALKQSPASPHRERRLVSQLGPTRVAYLVQKGQFFKDQETQSTPEATKAPFSRLEETKQRKQIKGSLKEERGPKGSKGAAGFVPFVKDKKSLAPSRMTPVLSRSKAANYRDASNSGTRKGTRWLPSVSWSFVPVAAASREPQVELLSTTEKAVQEASDKAMPIGKLSQVHPQATRNKTPRKHNQKARNIPRNILAIASGVRGAPKLKVLAPLEPISASKRTNTESTGSSEQLLKSQSFPTQPAGVGQRLLGAQPIGSAASVFLNPQQRASESVQQTQKRRRLLLSTSGKLKAKRPQAPRRATHHSASQAISPQTFALLADASTNNKSDSNEVALKKGQARRPLQPRGTRSKSGRGTHRRQSPTSQERRVSASVISSDTLPVVARAESIEPSNTTSPRRAPVPRDLQPARLLRSSRSTQARLSSSPKTSIISGQSMVKPMAYGRTATPATDSPTFLTVPEPLKREKSQESLLMMDGPNKKSKKRSKSNSSVLEKQKRFVIKPDGIEVEDVSPPEPEVENEIPKSTGGISWKAPDSVTSAMSGSRSPTSRNTGSNRNSRGSSSHRRNKELSAEQLAEETILAILTELSNSSPEAQALLDDVYRQVEHIRRLNKFRQI